VQSTMFSKNDMRAIAAEFLGMLFFVFVSAGGVVGALAFAEATPIQSGLLITGGTLVAIALAHGIGILVAVAWTANLSGGHINPAVTLAMLATKHITAHKAAAYIVAQCLGAIAGGVLLKLAIPADSEGKLGLHSLGFGTSEGEALLMEALMTGFLVLVIFNVAVSNKGWGTNAPIAIGLTVLLIHLVAVPFTGASVNPARSLGAAVAANDYKDYWIYVIGPCVGALVVAAGWLGWRNLGEDKLEEPDTDDPQPAAKQGVA
jgi:MIP family channel proteins